jgi:DNA repair exonuclease SbcCD nuclease subunit
MKFVHSADIHLDSPMRGLARYDGAPVERLRLATRVALDNLVELAIEERSDALLIAGDLFDGDWSDHGTGACFARAMARLREAGVRVVTIAGNHDAASKLTKSLRMPDNVRTLSTNVPETVVFEDLGLAVHGQGFATPAVVNDLSAAYPNPLPGLVNVGLLHTCAEGRDGHEPYAPCRPDRLAEHGYDYWALGHVHRREVLMGEPPVVFAGCIQGRHVREAGPKGATVVQIASDGTVQLKERVLDDVRWAVCDVDLSGADGVDDAYARVAAELAVTARDCGDRLLAVRARLTGRTSAHRALVHDRDRLRHEIALLATDAVRGEAWLERVVLDTAEPVDVSSDGDDAYAELIRSFEAVPTEEGWVALAQELKPLAAKLPRALLADFDPSDPATIAKVLADVARSLPVRLLEGTG